MTKFASQQEIDEIREHAARIKIRDENPYVYTSSYERNYAKEIAEGLLEADKKDMEIYRKNKYVYPLIERETNFQVTWKTKLSDLRWHHRILNI